MKSNIRKLSTKEILVQHQRAEAPRLIAQSKVLLHNIRSMHNVGSVFRSCDAFGVGEVVITGFTPAPPRPEITKTAIGAEEFVSWSNPKDVISYIANCKKEGYVLIGLEQTTQGTLLPAFEAPDNRYLFVLGNEVTGLDEQLMPFIDVFVSIPQFGQKHSLNVSVATGVLLYAVLERALEAQNSE
ncbi:MAG: TrmH family RNA methyltransferase [Bacteroidota bacterium]